MPDRRGPFRPTYDQLAALVAAQAERIAELEAIELVVLQLQAANQALQARVAELERQLRATSATSSKPPSSDGLRKPPHPARPREPGARRPGKQPGAPGAHLAMVADPDEIVAHRPQRCEGCGADLLLAPVTGTVARQVAEVPEVRLRTVEHQAERRVCSCGRVTTAAFPPAARGAVC
jgi:transposase